MGAEFTRGRVARFAAATSRQGFRRSLKEMGTNRTSRNPGLKPMVHPRHVGATMNAGKPMGPKHCHNVQPRKRDRATGLTAPPAAGLVPRRFAMASAPSQRRGISVINDTASLSHKDGHDVQWASDGFGRIGFFVTCHCDGNGPPNRHRSWRGQ